MGNISDYTRVLAAKLADVFVVDQTDNGTTETKSATLEQIGTAIGTLQNFADLDTSNKNLVDAINEIASYTPIYGNTASGSIATFDTSLALPLQDCIVNIDANVGGVSECNLKVSNKNLLDVTETSVVGDVNFTFNADGTITVSGGISTGNRYANVGHVGLPAGTYCTSGFPNEWIGGSTRKASIIICKNAYSGSSDVIKVLFNNDNPTDTFTLTEYTDCYLRVYVYGGAGTLSNEVFAPQIEVGTIASNFVTHTEKLYNIPFGQSITNGGLLNVLTGELNSGGTEIQVIPKQFQTIKGVNNIYADTGNTSVVYACSLKDYIDGQ